MGSQLLKRPIYGRRADELRMIRKCNPIGHNRQCPILPPVSSSIPSSASSSGPSALLRRSQGLNVNLFVVKTFSSDLEQGWVEGWRCGVGWGGVGKGLGLNSCVCLCVVVAVVSGGGGGCGGVWFFRWRW